MHTDPTLLTDTVSTVMRLEEMRAQSAAKNIAMANVPGAHLQRFDASGEFQRLRTVLGDSALLAGEIAGIRANDASAYLQADGAAPASLDAQVAEMASASERYQALGEGLSRQFALMRLAIGGGK